MELKQKPNYILDAQTKKGERMTSFALHIEDALLDFQDWVDLQKMQANDLWYADLFEFDSHKHMGTLLINNNGFVELSPAPENSRAVLFKRNRFIARLKGELR